MNAPLFRAKKIDSDKYIIGYLLPEYKGNFYLSTEWSRDFDGDTPNFIQIDITTLSIHFPEMLDNNRDKIFASLQDDGKGGDITLTKDGYNLYKRVHLFFKDGYSGSIDIEIVETFIKRSSFVSDIKIIDVKK